jgi:site-specific recombinase XerD
MSAIFKFETVAAESTRPFLSDLARAYAAASLRRNTRRAYSSAIRTWLQWKGTDDLEPADPIDIANFIAEQAASGKSISTLRTLISALKAAHRANGWDFQSGACELACVMRGISNSECRLIRQAEPMRPAMLSDILNHLTAGVPSPIALRDAALLATGYSFGLRRSELVGLDFAQLGRGAHRGTGVLRLCASAIEIEFALSKTTSGRPESVSIPAECGATISVALKRWLDAAGITPGEALFHRLHKGGKVGDRLSDQTVGAIIKARVAEHAIRTSRLDPRSAKRHAQRYSGHSLRVGLCTAAAEAGADMRAIASITRHRSMTMVSQYAVRADQTRTSPHRYPSVALTMMEGDDGIGN